MYKKIFSLIALAIVAAMFFSSCAVNKRGHLSDNTALASPGDLSYKSASTQFDLPPGFTRSNIKNELAAIV